jgi:predicted ferric reductase
MTIFAQAARPSAEIPRPDSSGRPSPVAGSQSRTLHPDDVLAAIAIAATVVAGWPVYLAFRAPAPVQPLALLAHVCGMLAGFGVVVLIGLMSRSPMIERGVGSDRLARWHGRGGRLVVGLVLVHAWAAVTAWASSRREGLWLSIWHVLRLPWLIAATLGTLLLLVVAVLSVRAARRRVSYESWHAIHLLIYLAVALGFVHQLAGPDLAGYRIIQIAWALLYTQVFALVLRHRVITPLRNSTRHRMRVKAVVPEAAGVVSIVVEGRHLDELGAQSGQFFRWRFLTPDTWTSAHPFSLSAAPSSTELRLTVKSLGTGSKNLQQLEPGTWIMAEGPYGAITAERRTRRDVLLIAGGVGITPMRALFETMPLVPGQDLLLLYRARSRDEILFRAELEQISRCRGARLNYLLGDQLGPLTPDLLRYLVPNLADRDVYLCGSPRLAGAVRKSLRSAGLPDRQLHEERFDF